MVRILWAHVRALGHMAVWLQMQWMEEKLKVANGQSGDSEAHLFQRCQELQAAMQEKDDVVAQLEQQLEEQVEQIHVRTFHHSSRCPASHSGSV